MLAEGLKALLATAAPIAAVTGAPRGDGTFAYFAAQMPEAYALPAIVVTQISGEGLPTLDGANAFHSARIQFSCYGKSFADAKKLQTALRRYFEGWRGTLPDGTEVDAVILELESDGFEQDALIYHAPIDFRILYRDLGN